MSLRLGVIMDPIGSIKIHKDSSFAMLLEAQHRGWELRYMELADISLQNNQVVANSKQLNVMDNPDHWYDYSDLQSHLLSDCDVILMRKDPPFDMEYIYATYLLELVAQQGTLVVNRPDSLRACNEKLYTAWFPQCCAESLVSRSLSDFSNFLQQHHEIVVKPLDGMGGRSIFTVRESDTNSNVIFETLTDHGQRFAMAQRFIPEITQGDKRILLINGEPIPYALARIPQGKDGRGNLAAGAQAEGVELNDRDHWICKQIGTDLKQRGLLFVGIDVIGDWLTEINVTSPTCIRELDTLYDLNISAQLLDAIEQQHAARP